MLELLGLGAVGIALVTIPVTLAVVFAEDGAPEPPARRAPAAVLLLHGAATPASRVHPSAAVDAIHCRPTRGWYALTFDGGPVPRKTRALAATIRRARAVGTFFVIGDRAAAHPELVDVQRRVGEVAGHGFTHVKLPRVSRERRIEEVRATARLLGHPNRFIRPPFGASDAATDADIAASGLIPVYWTVNTRDTAERAPAAIVRRALAVRPGGIVLLNEGLDATIEAVPAIVARLRARGLCPGLLHPVKTAVTGANGRAFYVQAVKP
jgi:peptidoglycan/xylan/chitin deacetylase (PgdA/CDA1 family)